MAPPAPPSVNGALRDQLPDFSGAAAVTAVFISCREGNGGPLLYDHRALHAGMHVACPTDVNVKVTVRPTLVVSVGGLDASDGVALVTSVVGVA
jgi:hypothetical protein